jgi:hypothetical protein
MWCIQASEAHEMVNLAALVDNDLKKHPDDPETRHGAMNLLRRFVTNSYPRGNETTVAGTAMRWALMLQCDELYQASLARWARFSHSRTHIFQEIAKHLRKVRAENQEPVDWELRYVALHELLFLISVRSGMAIICVLLFQYMKDGSRQISSRCR